MLLVQKWPFFQHYFLGNIGKENVFYDILERKTPLQAIKKKCKKSENSRFSKGVNACFWSKNRHFSNLFFQAIQNRKMSFTIFQNEKTPFQAIKPRGSKSRKTHIFPKGLTHGFCPKMAIFPTFFFRQYRPEKCLLRYSRTKKRLSRLKNQKFKKSKNWPFFKGVNPWFWSKNGHFSNFFFQAIQAKKMSFTIFQNDKTPFQAIKTRSSKIDIFPRGLTHGFGP